MSTADLNIRLQVASLGALEAITAPCGVFAMLPDGAVYVQQTSPTGANWVPMKDADGAASFAEVDMFPHDDDYLTSFEEV